MSAGVNSSRTVSLGDERVDPGPDHGLTGHVDAALRQLREGCRSFEPDMIIISANLTDFGTAGPVNLTGMSQHEFFLVNVFHLENPRQHSESSLTRIRPFDT